MFNLFESDKRVVLDAHRIFVYGEALHQEKSHTESICPLIQDVRAFIALTIAIWVIVKFIKRCDSDQNKEGN